MKKSLLLIAALLLAYALPVLGQTANACNGASGCLADQIFSVGSGASAPISISTGPFSGMSFLKIEFTPMPNSNVTGCTVAVDSQVGSGNWVFGGAIAAQSCSGSGYAVAGPISVNNVQLDIAVQGTGAVRVRLLGALSTFATSGIGTLTGISPPSGSFLSGGGLSGNLALTLQNCITTGQVPVYNTSSGWGCGAGSGFSAAHDLSGSASSQTVIGINGVLLSGLGNGIYKFAAGVPSVASAGTDYVIPSGSVASFGGNLAGDVNGTQSATVVARINGTQLSGLATGILKNTTGTGVPTIAQAGTDYVAPASLANYCTLTGCVFSGALTGVTSINGLSLSSLSTGFQISGGTTQKSLTIANTLTLQGSDGVTLNYGSGGTLLSGAFAAAYSLPTATSTVLGGVKPDGASILNSAGVISATPTSIGLGNVTNAVQALASIWPNTTPTSGKIPVGSGSAWAAQTLSQDVVISASAVATVQGLNTTPFCTSGFSPTAGESVTYFTTGFANAPCWGVSAGNGTVNTGTATQMSFYAASGTAVSPDTNLTDSGGTLAYNGAFSAQSGTFTGSGAGIIPFGQGTDNSSKCGSTFVCPEAPSTVTGYTFQWPGAPPAGTDFMQCTAATPSVCNWVGTFQFTAIVPGVNTVVGLWGIEPATALGGSSADVSFIGAPSETNTAQVVNIDTPSGSSQPAFRLGIQGVSQFQVVEQVPSVGAQGEVLIGSVVTPGNIGLTPFAKFIVMTSGTLSAGNVMREWAACTTCTADLNQWNTASAAGTGFNFLSAWTNVTSTNTTNGGGTQVFTIRGDGAITNGIWLGNTVAAGEGGTGVANSSTLTLGTSNVNLATLGSGFVYNTTTTGALSNPTTGQTATLLQALSGCNTSGYVLTPAGSDCVAASGGSAFLNGGSSTQSGNATVTDSGGYSSITTISGTAPATTPLIQFIFPTGNGSGGAFNPAWSMGRATSATDNGPVLQITTYGNGPQNTNNSGNGLLDIFGNGSVVPLQTWSCSSVSGAVISVSAAYLLGASGQCGSEVIANATGTSGVNALIPASANYLITNSSKEIVAGTTMPVASGGTNAATAGAALISLFPTASEVGDLVYCSAYSSGCTAWTLLAGNTTGTRVLQETSAGAPSWVVGGAGTVTATSSGYSSGTVLAAFNSATNIVVPTYTSVVSLFGSGTCSGYLKSDGTCGTVTLNGITAATGANLTIANANYEQQWQWQLTSTTPGMQLGESGASTGTGSILNVATLSGSTAIPLSISATTSSAACLFQINGGTSGVTEEACIIPSGYVQSLNGFTGTTGTGDVQYTGGLAGAYTSNGVAAGAIFGGSNASNSGSATKGGYSVLFGGMLTNATPNTAATEGVVQIQAGYLLGTAIANLGDVVCGTSTPYKVTDCGTAPALNIVGIADTTTNPVGVVTDAQALVKFDGATTVGDVACMGTTTAGEAHDNGTSACVLGSAIGIIINNSGTITIMTGTTQTATAMSSTLALVQLHISQ